MISEPFKNKDNIKILALDFENCTTNGHMVHDNIMVAYLEVLGSTNLDLFYFQEYFCTNSINQ